MELSKGGAVISQFFDQLGDSNAAVLFLDFDGTLAPFHADPQQVDMYPGIAPRLDRLIQETGTRLIVVSGRPVDNLRTFMRLNTVPELWGCHGAERLVNDNKRTQDLSEKQEKGLKQGLVILLATLPTVRHESKPYSIAVHWRGEPIPTQQNIAKTVRELWEPLAAAHELVVADFDNGLELRPENIHKGVVVDTVLRDYPEGVPAAYLGDDYTDEDAFKAMGKRGLKALVRREPRATAADLILNPPEDVIAFLDRWIDCIGGSK
ncbi:MAG: trehalose-phosphatase [Chlamydiales bacterium]|nr:trehalose-phosphatase [Chlamydiales bacterium]